jgi:hypothetical protein
VTPHHDGYKWVALSNTTIGMLMATINSSIVLIALPDIFRGIHLGPLEPGNSGYLLWMLMGLPGRDRVRARHLPEHRP